METTAQHQRLAMGLLRLRRRAGLSYLARFDRMVAGLEADPRVRVTHYWVGDPVSEHTILRVEDGLGYRLDDRIKSFYREANGLQLRWVDVHREERGGETMRERARTLQDAEGVVDLLPLRQAFAGVDGEHELYWDWTAEPETPLEEWDDEEPSAVDRERHRHSLTTWLAEAAPVGGVDHDASLALYPTDFGSYLEQILTYRGHRHGWLTFDPRWTGERSLIQIPPADPLRIDELLALSRRG